MFDQINNDRARHARGIIFGYICTGVAFVAYIPLAMAIGSIAIFIISIPFLGGGLFAAYNYKKIKQLSNDFKKKYVAEELSNVFPESNYIYDQGFTEEEVVDSNLLLKTDKFYSEDLITGIFEGVNFKSSDVEQKDERGSGEDASVVTVFQGRFYEFDFHKKFKHNLLLLQPGNFRPFSGFQRVDTEIIHFNSQLKIYAKSELEVFYILTPDFMEQLLYFDKKYLDKISFSFKDNKLFIAIDSRKDYFDIKAFVTIDESIFLEYREELEDIKDLIQSLNLNQTIFS